MQTSEARTGRELQRYGSDGSRLCAGCLPVRIREDSNGTPIIEVLLVRSSKQLLKMKDATRARDNLDPKSSAEPIWVLPKGGWEQDETAEQAAHRECFEEAGITGSIIGEICTIQSLSKKGISVSTKIFLLIVETEHLIYPESNRPRMWLDFTDAEKVVKKRYTQVFSFAKSHPFFQNAHFERIR